MKKLFLKLKQVFSSTKKYKKKIILGLGVVLILFVTAFIYINLTNPTKINKYIASVINKSTPANNYFTDEVFYNAVIDAYNNQHQTNLPYTTNLSDDQLKTITTISYSGSSKPESEKILSIKGIEKLTSLTIINLKNNKLSHVDLSQNIKLQLITIDNCGIKSIDVSHNKELTTLWIPNNNLSSIDVSHNTKLTKLYLRFNDIESIALDNNSAITYLDIAFNDLTDINLSHNTVLEDLSLGNNNLSSIDLSHNTALEVLSLGNNNLSSVDLSHNTALDYLDLTSSNLSSIDLSHNTALEKLDLRDNNLSSVDLSNCSQLKNLYLDNNNLSNIVLGNFFNISDVSKYVGKQNSSIVYLNLGNNKIIQPQQNIKFYINDKIVIKEEISVNSFINEFGLINLTGKIYDGDNEKIVGNVETGNVLKIYDGTNVIQTLNISNLNSTAFTDDNFYYCAIDSYNSDTGSNLLYTDIMTDDQLLKIKTLDCNNKNIRDVSGIEKMQNIETIFLEENDIKNINLRNNKSLQNLFLLENKNLNSIDLSSLINLKALFIESNIITSLDLSSLINLESLVIKSNIISSLDLSHNTNLQELELFGLPITTLDLSHNTKIESLFFEKLHNIKDYSFINKFNLSSMGIKDCNITNIDLTNQTNLEFLELNNNSITNINLRNNINIYAIYLSNNNLKFLDLSNNKKLDDLSIDNNNFASTIYVQKDKSVSLPVILPNDKYKITDPDIAKISDNMITGLNIGTTTIKIYDYTAEIKVVDRLPGDLNNDGKISAGDYIAIRLHIMGRKSFTEEEKIYADVNNDGKISVSDYIAIRKYIMNGSFE